VKLTGAQILMEVLKEEKVDTIFGITGGAIIDIFDELARTDIRHINVRHEQAAVHAADGYARAKKKVGRMPGNLWPRRYQYCNRTCICLYGLYTIGCSYRSGTYKPYR